MLNHMRNHINSRFAKGLLILLALSFVLWGVGDIFKPNNIKYALKVGDMEYSWQEWQNLWQSKMSELRTQYGAQASNINPNIIQSTLLNQLIDDSLLIQEAESLGLVVNDNMVIKQISQMPVFKNAAGKFDKAGFNQRLKQLGISEARLVEIIKKSLLKDQLLLLFKSINNSPAYLADAVANAAELKREVEIYTLPLNSITVKDKPTAQDLEQTYQANLRQFTMPEVREISYLNITPQMLDDKIEISEKELQEYYNLKKELLFVPEKRNVAQLIFSNRSHAVRAQQLLEEGRPIQEVKQQVGAKNQQLYLNKIEHKGLSEDIGDVIFALNKDEVSQPVFSPLGWHIFTVTEIYPEHHIPYVEIKEQLSKQLEQEKKQHTISELLNSISSQLDGGADLVTIAEAHKLKLNHAKLSAGHVDGIPKELQSGEFINRVFNTAKDENTGFFKTDDNTFVIAQLVNITSSFAKPQSQVNKDVKAIWYKQTRKEKVENIRDELIAAGKVNSIAKVVEQYKIKRVIENISRGDGKTLSTLPRDVFEVGNKEFTSIYYDHKQFKLVRVLDTYKAPQDSLKDAKDNIALSLAGFSENELVRGYVEALKQRYEISISPRLLEMQDS